MYHSKTNKFCMIRDCDLISHYQHPLTLLLQSGWGMDLSDWSNRNGNWALDRKCSHTTWPLNGCVFGLNESSPETAPEYTSPGRSSVTTRKCQHNKKLPLGRLGSTAVCTSWLWSSLPKYCISSRCLAKPLKIPRAYIWHRKKQQEGFMKTWVPCIVSLGKKEANWRK